MEPHPELVKILLEAYRPCVAFESTCCGIMRWNPAAGHIPRGFCGAKGSLEDVKLVLVNAEPGNPHDGEHHETVTRSALDYLRSAYEYAYKCFENETDPFHKNIRRYILDGCFPEMSFDKQMQYTWIAESVLCSAPRECGPVPANIASVCRIRYLERQLKLFPNAIVVALGEKAAHRLRGWPGLEKALHPSCRESNDKKFGSWARIVEKVKGCTAASDLG